MAAGNQGNCSTQSLPSFRGDIKMNADIVGVPWTEIFLNEREETHRVIFLKTLCLAMIYQGSIAYGTAWFKLFPT
jgi:hypothetical protein